MAEHGTLHSYQRGCRCEACTEAQRLYMRNYYRRKRSRGRNVAPEVAFEAMRALLVELFPNGLTTEAERECEQEMAA